MIESTWIMAGDLGGALLAGSLIGGEREFRSRPAGLRTHALVCFGSALAMLIPPFVPSWVGPSDGFYQVDPIKITEGVLAGVGFIGAGVIFREQLSVRGLTTAASIWVTAAIGMLFGIGHHGPAVGATAATLVVLTLFNWLEKRMPGQIYARHTVAFRREAAPHREAYVALLAEHGIEAQEISFHVDREGGTFEYRMRLRAGDVQRFERLAHALRKDERPVAFEIIPAY